MFNARARVGGRDADARAGADLARSHEPEFLGHPKGLAFLFATEMWERFSYYGMRALLVLYMVDYLLNPERANEVLGLSALKRALEVLTGPLEAQPFSSHIYGLYTSLVYATPILGGLIADRWLGRRRTVAFGAALMVAGHFVMASEQLFLLALTLLILGNGAFKPNIVTQVGGLYAPHDLRRDRAFSVFYVGINIGAFFSPLVAGTLGEKIGWGWGFGSAGVGMTIGLVTYLYGLRYLPSDEPTGVKADAPSAARASLGASLVGLGLLFVPAALLTGAYEQQGNTIVLWAANFTDRSISLLGWSAEIPVTWFQAFNPLMVFLFTPPLVAWWGTLARSGREPQTTDKLAIGCFGIGAGYAIMAAAAFSSHGAKASWLWLLAYFAVITWFELHFYPVALSLVSRIAPSNSRSLLMGLWLAASFAGNLFAGWFGGLWSSLSSVAF
ncbi:MAG TPA: peptide MFS transporter, partial [Methylocystis sp.]|nr:peptide MFS transporter [Methylocystis sp.]